MQVCGRLKLYYRCCCLARVMLYSTRPAELVMKRMAHIDRFLRSLCSSCACCAMPGFHANFQLPQHAIAPTALWS